MTLLCLGIPESEEERSLKKQIMMMAVISCALRFLSRLLIVHFVRFMRWWKIFAVIIMRDEGHSLRRKTLSHDKHGSLVDTGSGMQKGAEYLPHPPQVAIT